MRKFGSYDWTDAAKRIIAALGTDGFFEAMRLDEGFEQIDGIGPEKSAAIRSWYANPKNQVLLEKLLARIDVEKLPPSVRAGGSCKDMTFVITGDVHHFRNRADFTRFVESQGGKVTGSVSKKTDFLVNNDAASDSAKNRKARELGIAILTEEEFLEKFVNI